MGVLFIDEVVFQLCSGGRTGVKVGCAPATVEVTIFVSPLTIEMLILTMITLMMVVFS